MCTVKSPSCLFLVGLHRQQDCSQPLAQRHSVVFYTFFKTPERELPPQFRHDRELLHIRRAAPLLLHTPHGVGAFRRGRLRGCHALGRNVTGRD